MHILYSAYIREDRFIEDLHRHLGPEYTYKVVRRGMPSDDCLGEADALVFVGQQRNSYPEQNQYFLFLEETAARKIPVLSIQRFRETLPGNNSKITRVLFRQGKSLNDVANELAKALLVQNAASPKKI